MSAGTNRFRGLFIVAVLIIVIAGMKAAKSVVVPSLIECDATFTRLTGIEPRVPVDGARLARKSMFFSSQKAIDKFRLPAESRATGHRGCGQVLPAEWLP